MHTKYDQSVLDFTIRFDKDLDSLILKLTAHTISDCTLFFDCGGLTEKKVLLLIECLEAQKNLKKLCLRARRFVDKECANILVEMVNQLISLESLTLEGIYSDDFADSLVKLIN
ncbi:MAG: hypothetical protein H0U73_02510 [Tatlockia sp.]|nr:hypothetical protein [Tatlockia sp.]